jgi:X-Pro dipeptidyl-peptidase (S15 family)
MRASFRWIPLALVLLVTPAGHAATVADVFGGHIACVESTGGVQFCQGTSTTRIETWDGVPLDVNVTIPPASMTGPFPLIVDMHGWSGSKSPGPYVAWANDGYVVLSYTARGFHQSCGSAASRMHDIGLSNPDVCNERGWIRLADARYEIRDTQYLAGRLADEGLVKPTKIGVTGISYGGGQSMILGALKNRIMLPDGSLVPWKSPNGLDMAIAAAAPFVPWTDLAYALTPNGRTLDYREQNPFGTRGGVQKKSWNELLYNVGLGVGEGFYAPPNTDFEADINLWNARTAQGEPYEGDSAAGAIIDEITSHHSAYYIDDSEPPAPFFIYNAWTDDLFPVDETVRYWRKIQAKHPDAEFALLYADFFGHPRAALAGGLDQPFDRANAFFARHLKGQGDPLVPIETYTQACNGATVEGPFTASDWDALHPGEVRYTSKKTQRFDSTGGKAENGDATDPLQGGPCRTVPGDDDPNAATYRLPAATGDGYTLLGSPTIIATIATTGANAQIAGRLWDVAPDGMQTLVAQAFYRPRTDNRGPQVFQLHPNGWHFPAGHVAKLELLGQSAPYGRPSNGVFTVTVSALELRLPVHETPSGKVIKAPAAHVLPPDPAEPLGCDLAPRTGCTAASAHGAALAIAVGPRGAADRLDWRWRGAASADFGDPTATTDYALCVYDGTAALIASALAPAGTTCGKKPCWSANRKGFRYADDARASTGVGTVALSTGVAATTCKLAGKGASVGVPALPASTPLTAQLVNADGTCWTATFTSPKKSSPRLLKAVSD